MFQIEPLSRTPIYEQLTEQVEKLLLAGVLHVHDQLPSVRSLSCELSVNPNTIQKAYTELCERGIVYAVQGRGCFIAPQAHEQLKIYGRERLKTLRALARELALAGIEKEALLTIIEESYQERGEYDASGEQSDQTV